MRASRVWLAGAAVVLGACGFTTISVEREHLPAPATAPLAQRSINRPVLVTIRRDADYGSTRWTRATISVDDDAVTSYIMDALGDGGVRRVVDSKEQAEFTLEVEYAVLAVDDNRSPSVGFTSTWVLHDARSGDEIARTAAIAEEEVASFGWGTSRFRDAIARSIAANAAEGVEFVVARLPPS